ncbi:MAG: hypothetical protein PHV65_05715 [Bacteroidales bacterium]|nr:hypothetical protein [Bacteroidales bacterium]
MRRAGLLIGLPHAKQVIDFVALQCKNIPHDGLWENKFIKEMKNIREISRQNKKNFVSLQK